MYVVVPFEDKIAIQPDQFDRDPADCLVEEIERKYCNKVVLGVGLCIIFYDFVEVGVPHIYPGEGSAHQLIKFRMVVFRPDEGEILVGKITHCDKQGVSIGLGFFGDIRVDKDKLPAPSTYNSTNNQSQYIWHYEGEDGQKGDHPIEVGHKVRFKVLNCIFPALIRGGARDRLPVGSGDGPAMKIIASMSLNDASALGSVHWWRS